mgnify:CR=1 FL=1
MGWGIRFPFRSSTWMDSANRTNSGIGRMGFNAVPIYGMAKMAGCVKSKGGELSVAKSGKDQYKGKGKGGKKGC